jgi:integrase/recombinase XerD
LGAVVLEDKWPVLARYERATTWLRIWTDLGRAPRTIDAYARGLAEYLEMCDREGVDPATANRAHVAVYVRELTERPSRRGANVVSIDSGVGLANATIQQRLVPVRLFYDFLIEEGLRESNPVGRGRYTPGRRFGGHERGIVPRLTKLPWIPTDQQWTAILTVARDEPARNRVMLALAYDAALRREELCALRTGDLDPAHRTLRIRAETTKNRLERVVPYSASTGALLTDYLAHRAGISRARGPLWLSESRRNHAQPLSLWTWSKVVRRIALAADVPRFATHTLRHLCLTDLARMGWELHAIATFAGHRSTESTLAYIHLSGRDLADKLERSMQQLHAWRIQQLADLDLEPTGAPA